MELFGFWVQIHHGWYRVLTVMSPCGISKARAYMVDDAGTDIISHPGHLTKYIERERGALQRMIETYDIRILERAEWNAKKQTYGEQIYD